MIDFLAEPPVIRSGGHSDNRTGTSPLCGWGWAIRTGNVNPLPTRSGAPAEPHPAQPQREVGSGARFCEARSPGGGRGSATRS